MIDLGSLPALIAVVVNFVLIITSFFFGRLVGLADGRYDRLMLKLHLRHHEEVSEFRKSLNHYDTIISRAIWQRRIHREGVYKMAYVIRLCGGAPANKLRGIEKRIDKAVAEAVELEISKSMMTGEIT